MMSGIKELLKDSCIFLRDIWYATEDFFEFKVWPHRLEWIVGLTGYLLHLIYYYYFTYYLMLT